MRGSSFRHAVTLLAIVAVLSSVPVEAAPYVLHPEDAAYLSLALGMMLVPWDQEVYEGIRGLPVRESVIWKGFSLAGSPQVALGTALGLTGLGSEFGRDLSRVLLVNGAVTLGLKSLTGMARPQTGLGPILTGPTMNNDYGAFPSAHTSSAFAAATVVAHYYPEDAGWAYLAAALVGLSRIFVEAHWPSTVVFGAGLGYLTARFVLDWE
jgi:membrane-associated phospholipid phosphatase